MNPLLLKNITSKIQLTKEEIAILETFWKEKNIEKGEYLVRNGDVCKYDSFVISGAFKIFYIHPETGKEEILSFAIEDWWATDLDSFCHQKASIYNIQALEKSAVIQISHHQFDELVKTIPKMEHYFRVILQGHNASIHQRIILANAFSAEERYRDFIEKYPKMVQKIPQYLIASYLGITPEFLSKLRSKK